MRLVYVMPDNGVLVREICAKARDGENRDQWLERHAHKARPSDAQFWVCVDESGLPKSNREAWVWDGQRVVVDPSRIRPKTSPAVVASEPGAPVDLSPLYELINQVRSEVSHYMAESFAAMRDDVKRYHYELQYALNAVKKDADVPTADDQAVRAGARERLAEIGAAQGLSWQQVADSIIALHNADADRLVRP